MAIVYSVSSSLLLRSHRFLSVNFWNILRTGPVKNRVKTGLAGTAFEPSFRTLHRSCTNCMTSPLSLRLITWVELASKFGVGPSKLTYRNGSCICMRNRCLRGFVYLHKNRNLSDQRLAIKTGSATFLNEFANEGELPSSRSYLRGNLHKRRHCSCHLMAARHHYGTDSSKSSTQHGLSLSNPSLRAYIQHLAQEHQEIAEQLTDEQHALDGKKQKRLRRRLAELTPLVEKMGEWNDRQTELAEIEELISAQDKEMKEMALQEKQECLEDRDNLEKEILSLLAPVDKTDHNDIIVEFSAGVGGQEAMLFAADMFEMYERFAAYKNWDFQRLEYFTTELGGLRHASASMSGDDAYKLMRQEAGVHRVQRVPRTEKAGRVHTSTMAVAVLPQPKEIDLKLDPKDLRVETKKASGAGGQHVNTTDSAVRITHLPTGTVAESQQERSQLKNRAIAMTLLQAKIYSAMLASRESAERSLRRSQVGTSGRSEKIRTYNFQQDRVTDHRIGESVFDVGGFLSGGERLDEMLWSLMKEDEEESVLRMVEDFVESQKR